MVRLFSAICAVLITLSTAACGDPADGSPVVPTVGTIATLQGVVVSSSTFVPLAGVVVVIQGVRLTTGADGTFAVSGLKPGDALLTAERQGFQPFSGRVFLDGAVVYNFLMAPLSGLKNAGT